MRLVRRTFDRAMDARVAVIADAGLSKDERIALVRRHGGFSQAYSTAVQERLSYYGDAGGYIAYAIKMGGVMALGDPVAARRRWPDLLAGFVRDAGNPAFAEISHETADLLAGMDYSIARLGTDTALDLQTYDFAGPNKERIRYAANWLARQGYRIVEEDGLPGSGEALAALSARWRDTRRVRRREMAFLNRPFPTEPDPLMRRFVLISPQGEAVALLYFDPVFEDGEAVGHVAVFKRRLPGAPSHAEHGLMKHAAEIFRREGQVVLFTSLAPLADTSPSGFRESGPFRRALGRCFRSPLVNARIFNLEGHAEQRRRLHGRAVPRYFAWKGGSPFVHFVRLLRLCKAL